MFVWTSPSQREASFHHEPVRRMRDGQRIVSDVTAKPAMERRLNRPCFRINASNVPGRRRVPR